VGQVSTRRTRRTRLRSRRRRERLIQMRHAYRNHERRPWDAARTKDTAFDDALKRQSFTKDERRQIARNTRASMDG